LNSLLDGREIELAFGCLLGKQGIRNLFYAGGCVVKVETTPCFVRLGVRNSFPGLFLTVAPGAGLASHACGRKIRVRSWLDFTADLVRRQINRTGKLQNRHVHVSRQQLSLAGNVFRLLLSRESADTSEGFTDP